MSRSNWSNESRHARGYGTAWDKLRKLVLRRDYGLCQCDNCKGPGVLTPATEVHHVVSKAAAARLSWTEEQINSMDNLIAINTECHKRLTQMELGGTPKPKLRIGLDGYPIEG